MQENPADQPARADGEPPKPVVRLLSRVVRFVLVVAILLVGFAIAKHWMENRPMAHRRPAQEQVRLVEAVAVRRADHPVTVRAMGTVVPAQAIDLTAEVGGRVIEVSDDFVPGGRFAAAEPMLRIDPSDYDLALLQRQSALAQARSDLRMEMGQQSVSRREYELLGQDVQEDDRDLLLRKPQLDKAKADVAMAEAALKQAQLDLARTQVSAPFNAVIRSTRVDLGSRVNVGEALCSLVGTDEYWVQVSVPVDELAWIDLPAAQGGDGAEVRIYDLTAWGADVFRRGAVTKLLPDLEPGSRMARVLVSVPDPLDLEEAGRRHPLVLDAYVRVEIKGRTLPDVVKVPRGALRDGSRIWVMTPDGALDIRPVDVLWSGNDDVYVSDGLKDGELMITSDLAAPVQGMALRRHKSADGDATAEAPGSQLANPEVQGDGGPDGVGAVGVAATGRMSEAGQADPATEAAP